MGQVEDGAGDASSEELRMVDWMRKFEVNLFRFGVYLNRFNSRLIQRRSQVR